MGRFVDRIIPLQLLCRANEEELNNALPEFIASKFTGIDESLTVFGRGGCWAR